MVVVLPVPLTPTTRMTCGLCDRSSSSGSATGVSTFSTSSAMIGAHLGVGDVAAVAAGRQRVGDAHRRLHAEIGADQHVLQVLQRVLVEPALGEDAGDVARQLLRRARQAVAQPLEPARPGAGCEARSRLGRLLLDFPGDGDLAGWRTAAPCRLRALGAGTSGCAGTCGSTGSVGDGTSSGAGSGSRQARPDLERRRRRRFRGHGRSVLRRRHFRRRRLGFGRRRVGSGSGASGSSGGEPAALPAGSAARPASAAGRAAAARRARPRRAQLLERAKIERRQRLRLGGPLLDLVAAKGKHLLDEAERHAGSRLGRQRGERRGDQPLAVMPRNRRRDDLARLAGVDRSQRKTFGAAEPVALDQDRLPACRQAHRDAGDGPPRPRRAAAPRAP